MTSTQAVAQLFELHLSVKLTAPWLVHGNDPGHLGLDAVQLRAHDGLRILPGTLLVGRIRDAWHTLIHDYGLGSEVPAPTDWFGSQRNIERATSGMGQPTNTPQRAGPGRSRVFVDDLFEVATNKVDTSVTPLATRVRIDEVTEAADDGMLQFIEQGEAPGTEIEFNGVWRVWLPQLAAAETLAMHLSKGLHFHSQLGALRNIGFGRLNSATVTARVPKTRLDSLQLDAFCNGKSKATRGLLLRFSQPLSLANRRINGNVFESSDIVSGATIKGALATAYESRFGRNHPKPGWFDELRVTHGFPSTAKPAAPPAKRPSVRPLNWLANRKGALFTHEGDHLPLQDGTALAFEGDWKGNAVRNAAARCQWGATQRQLRVRTAMANGRAGDGELFAYRCVVPEQDTVWIAGLSLPDDKSDRMSQWEEIGKLLADQPLGPIGKTDAFAQVELLAEVSHVWPSRAPSCAEVTLLLQTDALLLSASQCQGMAFDDDKMLREALQSNLRDMAQQIVGERACQLDLSVSSLHARFRFAGGHYLYHAQTKVSGSTAYRPYVLMAAGSVLRLRFADDSIGSEVFANWERRGLPLCTAVAKEHGKDWKTNTYIPENGWGEVWVNPDHGLSPLENSAPQQRE